MVVYLVLLVQVWYHTGEKIIPDVPALLRARGHSTGTSTVPQALTEKIDS